MHGMHSAVEAQSKRKKYLERNRIAAHKCRRKKSEEVRSLQEKLSAMETKKKDLTLELAQVKDELDSLQSLVNHTHVIIIRDMEPRGAKCRIKDKFYNCAPRSPNL